MTKGKHWTLTYDYFDPGKEGVREALCTLGNGYFATRGASEESIADGIHYPGTYLAGGYNRLITETAGRMIENEDLVNIPNWLGLTYRVDDSEWFQLKAVEIISYHQELQIDKGILLRRIHFKDAHGRESLLTQKRLVHMQHFHLAAIQWTLTPKNWSGKVEIRSSLDGTVTNSGVARYGDLNSQHLEPLEHQCLKPEGMYLKVQTTQSELRIAQAARTKVHLNDNTLSPSACYVTENCYVAEQFFLDVNKDEEVVIDKIVAIHTSRDKATSECGLAAINAVHRAPDFSELERSQIQAWKHLWRHYDIEIDLKSNDYTRHPLLILRLHIFHLLQTTSMNIIDNDVGVPARGWHGEAYRGHIFWDELFIFPILNLRTPEITQELLKYRYRRLEAARRHAHDGGEKGAMYPWQSGSSGREESQLVHLNPNSGRWIDDNSSIQRHVNAAIAYNVWRYYEVTGDIEFFFTHGTEMIIEIARFWTSISSYNKELDRYEILGVMGPDEYHDGYPDSEKPGIDNNAYTNVMAVWVICRALEALEILPSDHVQELREKLNITDEELNYWDEVSRKMRIVFHGDGIISQFEGFEKLKEFDWEGYRAKYSDIQRLDRILESEGDSPNNYQLSKQADVLMLFYLFSVEELEQLFERLGYEFHNDTVTKTIEYHLKRTSHGSTLSRIVHSWVLSRSERPASWELFLTALESDVSDIQGGTTAEGIHLGAMAGTVDIVQRCYSGIELREGILWFNPCLPDEVNRLRLRINYRGHSIEIEFTSEVFKIKSLPSIAESITIGIQNETHTLYAGEEKEFRLGRELQSSS